MAHDTAAGQLAGLPDACRFLNPHDLVAVLERPHSCGLGNRLKGMTDSARGVPLPRGSLLARAMAFIVPWFAGPIALAITWWVVGVPASNCGGFCAMAAPGAYLALALYVIIACALSVGIAAAAASSRLVRASGRPALIVGAAGSIPVIVLASASLWWLWQALATA